SWHRLPGRSQRALHRSREPPQSGWRTHGMRSAALAIMIVSVANFACSESPRTAVSSACQPTRGQSLPPTAGDGAAGWSIRLGPGGDVAGSPESDAIAQRGMPLTVSGVVYGHDCTMPVAGARMHVWQADADGRYGPGRTDGGAYCCY